MEEHAEPMPEPGSATTPYPALATCRTYNLSPNMTSRQNGERSIMAQYACSAKRMHAALTSQGPRGQHPAILVQSDASPVPRRIDMAIVHAGGNGYDTHSPIADRQDASLILPITGWDPWQGTQRSSRPAESPDPDDRGHGPQPPAASRRPTTMGGYLLRCHHGHHSSTMSHPATMWPQDHEGSHDSDEH